jgi:nitronate monooxygenase
VSPSENMLPLSLRLRVPLIVAPMAGGPSSPDLVAAASKAGALGSIGAAYSSPAAIEDFAAAVRRQTDQPFAINLFAPHPVPTVSPKDIEAAISDTSRYREELGLSAPSVAPPYEENFDVQFEAVLRIKPAVFSFVFGLLPSEYINAANKEQIFIIGAATSLDEASMLEVIGVDAIVLQGIEAGGHRAIFDPQEPDPEIVTVDLLDACVRKLKVPLVASGGIMNVNDVRTALKHGAQAVQMGTAFLACREAGTSAPYKSRLLGPEGRRTKTTRAFSGRLARGIVNRFMDEMESEARTVLPFPVQNKFTRDIRVAATAKGSAEFLSLWSGSGGGQLWQGTAADLIAELFSTSP